MQTLSILIPVLAVIVSAFSLYYAYKNFKESIRILNEIRDMDRKKTESKPKEVKPNSKPIVYRGNN